MPNHDIRRYHMRDQVHGRVRSLEATRAPRIFAAGSTWPVAIVALAAVMVAEVLLRLPHA